MTGPRLLAVDIDGTLVRRDGSIAPEDAAAIARARAAGIAVTLVTGRLYSGSRGLARELALDGPIACIDGCQIVDLASESALVHHTLAGSHALALRDVLARHELATFLFAQDRVVHDAAGDPFHGYVAAWTSDITRVTQLGAHAAWREADGLTAALALAPHAAISGAAAEIRAALGEAVYVVAFPIGYLPGLSALVVRTSGPNKGTAISWLAAHHGCSVADVVAIGDWWNDLPMFAVAGRSFAMASGPEPVRAAATDLLEAVAGRGGGVAEVVRRVWDL